MPTSCLRGSAPYVFMSFADSHCVGGDGSAATSPGGLGAAVSQEKTREVGLGESLRRRLIVMVVARRKSVEWRCRPTAAVTRRVSTIRRASRHGLLPMPGRRVLPTRNPTRSVGGLERHTGPSLNKMRVRSAFAIFRQYSIPCAGRVRVRSPPARISAFPRLAIRDPHLHQPVLQLQHP